MEDVDVITPVEVKKRGFWLSAFLVLMFIANPLTAFAYFVNPEAIKQVYPSLTIYILYFMGLLAIINFGLSIAIWTWKKVGVYGIYTTMALAFCINIYAGLGFASSLMGLIGAVLIYFTTKNRWEHFT